MRHSRLDGPPVSRAVYTQRRKDASPGRRDMLLSIPVYVASPEEEAAFLRIVLIFVSVIVSALLSGSFCAWLANEKGRPLGAWFLLGLVFGPFALLAIVGAPTLVSRAATQSPAAPARKRRPGASQRQAALEAGNLAAGQAGDMRRAGVRRGHEAAHVSPDHQALLAANIARRERLDRVWTEQDD